MSLERQVLVRKAQNAITKKPALLISKESFYKDYFDIEEHDKLVLHENVCVIFNKGKVIAYRSSDEYYVIDTYEKFSFEVCNPN